MILLLPGLYRKRPAARSFGIGRSLTALPLPHHRTNGSRIRRFGRLSQMCTAYRPCTPTGASYSSRTNVGFIPATRLAPHGLAGCNAVVPWQATSPLFQSPRGEPFGPSARLAPPTMPSADFCLAVSANCSALSQFLSHARSQGTRQISQGKTQNVPRIDAEFIKHAPMENGGLRGHVPARPERATPQIRFVYLAPRFWIGLPSDPTSR